MALDRAGEAPWWRIMRLRPEFPVGALRGRRQIVEQSAEPAAPHQRIESTLNVGL